MADQFSPIPDDAEAESARFAFLVADELTGASEMLRRVLSEAADYREHALLLLRRLPMIVSSSCDLAEREEWLRFADATATNCRAIALELSFRDEESCECGA